MSATGSELACDSLESCCELVGARGGLVAAADTLETRNDIGRTLPFNKGGDALEIAVAAADKVYVGYETVLNFYLYNTRACSRCLVLVFHNW